FPLLLAQGAEGIAVGLSSKILPHNVHEILDAAVLYLRGENFELYPDFPTGGFLDVSRYNDGQRGGRLRVRAKIDKLDNKTLVISEIPYGKTTETLIDSVIEAYEKGKIKIRKVENMTSESAQILVHLQPGTSSDKTIDALYAFTDCEISISPNCCVISEEKPVFVGVSDLLRHSVDRTMHILQRELEILRDEVCEKLHFASLEKIFIEKRIYKDKEYEQAPDMESAVAHVTDKIIRYAKHLLREVTRDDILRLFEIRMKRILRFSAEEADVQIAAFKAKIEQYTNDIEHIVDYTVRWYEHLKEKYGASYPRRTLLRSFDNIQAASVAEANEKLYINREEGFIGTMLKKDEYVCNCSAIDDIILFYKDGRYKVVKVADKLSVGKNILHLSVFKRDDRRTIYNAIYQNGKNGPYYMKRFFVTGVTRDKEYNITQGLPRTRVAYFTANPNGEAEVVKVILKPDTRLKKLQFDVDFSKLAIKNRASLGNLVTKNPVHRLSLKEAGRSTLGGLQVWFDPDVLRLNYEGRGKALGEFGPDDRVLVVLNDGSYYTSGFEATNHYEDNILRIEKYEPEKTWTAILNDADQGYPYLKRFCFEPTVKKQRFIGDNTASELLALSDNAGARFKVTFGGDDAFREALEIVAADYVGVKSSKAKGKRLTTYAVSAIEELSPLTVESVEENVEDSEPESEIEEPETIESGQSDDELRDEYSGQKRLF
ncbi:MAG: DNA gyrase/topoisomerase IV subunit A, partial [Muribaculaceae bacterium]|nr:DNA gyrase/topoisomerase IV subunit A [Muribaculaceae bacterium]